MLVQIDIVFNKSMCYLYNLIYLHLYKCSQLLLKTSVLCNLNVLKTLLNSSGY